jgi:dTDP-4-dehydrorhamnose reductase/beta-phosphoglucomutase-like phosphatase (HAD superfamily)
MILICGASGLVGKEMCNFLDKINVKYIGTYNKNKISGNNMFHVDFFNIVSLESFLLSHKIMFCFFFIVERLTDLCENNWNEIKTTNIDIAYNVSYLCNKLNIKFIHLSTDYVFDGLTQPNLPSTLTNPLQNYGISKLISEYRVLNNCTKFCIIRTPVLYSTLSKIHDNAVTLIGKNIMNLKKNKIYKEDNYSIRRPLYIQDFCQFLYDCTDSNYNGIYHFYNPYNKYTKYEICKIIGNYLNIELDNIVANNNKSNDCAPRPYDTQLQDNRINISNYSFTNFDETIKKCFNKFKHSKINISNKNDLFICLDMDGTIINTNIAHYNAYSNVFKKYNKSFLNINEWNQIILHDNINNYLKIQFDDDLFHKVKLEKLYFLKNEVISFTENSNIFLKYLIENDFNFCIVTNANKDTVDVFKQKLPLLNEIKQWICRDDFNLPKPNSECYELAKTKYYKNEKYIIGFEDSMVGYNSLKHLTDIIYIYNNEDLFKKCDCYLFDDYTKLIYF